MSILHWRTSKAFPRPLRQYHYGRGNIDRSMNAITVRSYTLNNLDFGQAFPLHPSFYLCYESSSDYSFSLFPHTHLAHTYSSTPIFKFQDDRSLWTQPAQDHQAADWCDLWPLRIRYYQYLHRPHHINENPYVIGGRSDLVHTQCARTVRETSALGGGR